MTVEIERKFLVDAAPGQSMLGAGDRLRQGYVAEEGDVSVRVRIGSSGAVLTVKAGRGLSRTEVELALTAEQAEALWPHTEGRRIEKTRYRIELTGPTGPVAELDSYAGSLDGLHTVEVEFGSVAAAEGFVAPAWFGRELTGDGAWTNASLARKGRPAG